jgi:hypothetical protein
MKCPYCSKNLVSGARSCGECGNYLGESFAGHGKSTQSRKAGLLMFVVGLFVLGVAIAVYFFVSR